MSRLPSVFLTTLALSCTLWLTPAPASAQNGTISGTIKNESDTLLVGVEVKVLDGAGAVVATAATNTFGVYTASVPAGTYYLHTNIVGGLLNEIHDDIKCLRACNPLTAVAQGTPVTVTSGATTTVNFILSPGGSISGKVTDQASAVLIGVPVNLVRDGVVRASGVSDVLGAFSFDQLTAGSYYLYTGDTTGDWIDEFWDDAPCSGACSSFAIPSQAGAIPVAPPPATADRNFALAPAGHISGTVTDDAVTPNPLSVLVAVYSTTGTQLDFDIADGSGAYDIGGLPTGSYYVATQFQGTRLNEVWDNKVCIGMCGVADVTGGTQIPVVAGQTTTGRSFALSEGGAISGTVTRDGNGTALEGVLVRAAGPDGAPRAFALTDATGAFTLRQLTTGDVNEVWDDKPCVLVCTPAEIAAGTPVTVTAGAITADRDFALQQFGRITGTVTLEGTNTPIGSAPIAAFNASGGLVASTVTSASGEYTITGLAGGTYFVATGLIGGALNEVYDNKPCPIICLPQFVVDQGTPIPVAAGAIVPGFNFALAGVGGISGVVNGPSGPLATVTVAAFAASNLTVPAGFAVTDSAGAYSISGLATGVYRVATSSSTFVNEVYDDIPCAATLCTAAELAQGAAVDVTAPSTTTAINFTLGQGTVIGGTITGESGPLQNILVLLLDSTGDLAGSAATNSSGVYLMAGLDAGTYYAYTVNDLGYFNEVYDNITCQGSCDLELALTGTPIALAQNGTATVDFQLVKGGRISGRITSESGAAIAGAEVVIVDGSGNDVSFMLSNSSGDYFTAGALAPGPYYLYAAASGHLAEYYDNVPCNGFCSEDDAPVRGTAVVVAEGAAVTDRNFALAPASRITGTVTSASGAPIEDADVEAYTLSGAFVGSGFTDEDGEYVIDGLPAGTYRIATDVSDNYVNEVWDNVTCLGSCGSDELQAGIPIVVGAAETVSGRNFALEPGAAIAGAVTDAATGAPIADVLVFALDAREEAVVVSTDDTGAYRIDGLPAGTYRLLTDDAQFAGYLNEIFDNVPCQRVTCSYTQVRQSGAPIVLTAGSSATANFGLALGGRITGTITDTATGAPVAGVSVHAVRRVGVDLDESASFPTGSSGVFTIAGLPAGAWSVFTSNGSGYFNEIHPDIPCPGFCSGSHALAGSAIAVTVGATSGGVNFALAQGGRIGGRVTDSATGTGVEEVLVTIVDAQGRRVSDGYTDDNGDYITGAGLPTGTFFAVVEDVFDGLLPEIFENMPCSAADCLARATTGTPIAVTTGATTPGRNFALEHGGRISGRVTNAAGDGVEDGSVFIYDVHGRFVDSASPARGGTFLTDRGLPAGTYHAFTFDFGGLVNEIFDNRPCLYECEPSAVTSGAPISVSLGVTTPGVNFALAAAAAPGAPYALEAATDAGRVRITWQAPDSGAAAVSYLLDAGLAPGTTVITIPVAGTQYLIDSAPPGRYFLRVRAVNAAGAGPASSELEMTVGAANVIAPDAPQFPVMTMVGRRLIMTWDPPYSGGPVGQYLIEAGSASGLSNIGSLFVTGPLFTYEPVPDGVYFLRVRARNAAGTSAPSDEVMLVVGGGPSPPQAPGEPAAVVHGSTVTLSWFAPPGPVSGYILEAGSASGLSNLATAALGPATTVSFPGIPRGTYYVRMRAVNAQGSSIVSDEVTVVVP